MELISSDCKRDGEWSLYSLQRRQQTKERKLSPTQSCETPPVRRPLVVSFTAPLVYRSGAYTGGENVVLQWHGKCL